MYGIKGFLGEVGEMGEPPRGSGSRPADVPAALAVVAVRRGPQRLGVLLPERHRDPGGVLEEREPALAVHLELRRDDLPARLLDPLDVVVHGIHEDVVRDPGLPVPRLQSPDAARGPIGRLEQRVVHPGDLLELPAEEAPVELLELLRVFRMELPVHDASWLGSVCYDVFLPEGNPQTREGY